MGSMDTTADSEPTILPALQNKSVISVVLGDYHNGALTANGKLLTWGNYSRGALGLGDPTTLDVGAPGGFPTAELLKAAVSRMGGTPPRVEVPTEVRFDHGLKKKIDRFCFAATAAGWHMGALVIDLEVRSFFRAIVSSSERDVSKQDGENEEVNSEFEDWPSQTMPGQFPHQLPNFPHGLGDVPIFQTRGLGPFRIGFAGRGLQRGAGRGV
jgi:SCF-associated factor 1